jgi:hypothetical protein
VTMPDRYNAWVERVTKPYRVLAWQPTVNVLGRRGHGSVTVPPLPGWAGQILNSARTGPTYDEYEMNFYVPSSTCSGQSCATDIWGGIGGYNDPGSALIQSGIWLDGEFCPQTGCNPRSPYLNIEYANNGVVQVPWSSLNYSQGDIIYALGWSCDVNGNISTTGGFGCYWFENYTTQKLSGIGQLPIPTGTLCPPGGCFFTGKTAEWIVEKPGGLVQADYAWEETYGVAWDTSGTAHNDTTDPYLLQDTKNSSGNYLTAVYFPANGGYGSSDTPTQPVLGFSWFNWQ